MHKEWLKKEVAIQEIEKSFSEEEKILGPKYAPTDIFLRQWEDFKSSLQEGDEIWRFSSPKDTWKKCADGLVYV